jgi:acylpyruvate hydrolase
MRFVSFQSSNQEGLALVSPNGQARALLASAASFPGSLGDLLRRGPDAILKAGATLAKAPVIDLADCVYLPPIATTSSKIVCVGLNYADHSKESNYELPAYPTLFGRFASSVIAHGAPLIKPLVSEQFDYEGELVAIIGEGGRHISRARALEHVAGYSLFNDASVRDFQHRTPQWTMGKNFDGTGAFGPCFVTSDELPAGAKSLKLETRLNGAVVQKASTSQMVFDVIELIAVISEAMTLAPGDLIVAGTPAGVGAGRKPPLFMKEGDVCEVEIEGIGILSNPVINEPAGRLS